MNRVALRLAALQLASDFADTFGDLIGMAEEILDFVQGEHEPELDDDTEGMSPQ